MMRRPPRSTRTEHSFPTRRSSDLVGVLRRRERRLQHVLRRLDVDPRNAGRRREVRRSRHQGHARSEEHTSELQSLMRISYAVFCLKKKNNQIQRIETQQYKKRKQTRLSTVSVSNPSYRTKR